MAQTKTPTSATEQNLRSEARNEAEQTTAEFKAAQGSNRSAASNGASDAARTTAEAATETEALARDTVRATTDLTAELWERNIALASRFVPAYIDSYERTVKSFSSVWEQAGQSAGKVGESATSAPRAVTNSFVQAGQALSEIPQTVGSALTGAGKAFAQVPQSLGESVSGQVPQTFPELAKAQASFLRDFAEYSASAAREGVRRDDAR